MARPVVPYVGFKGWMAPFLKERASTFTEPFELFDPFFGGGGSLQAIAGHKRLARVEVSDTLSPICDLWRWLLRDPSQLRIDIEALHESHPPTTDAYYEVRAEAHDDPVCLLYVLLWGFNGLFRTNKKGLCNVPQGRGPRHDRPEAAIDRVFERAEEIRKRLARKEVYAYIEHRTFEVAMADALSPRRARLPVFAIFDPPYYGGFAGYAGGWTEADLTRLKRSIVAMSQARPGLYLLCGKPENLADLSTPWEVVRLSRKSSVSCDPSTRGDFSEAVALLDTRAA